MPHGQRDWGNIGADKVQHGLSDMAELAARLGSGNLFNREGYVIFLESFEYGLGGWEWSKGGTYGDVFLSAEARRTGAYSCKLSAGTEAGSASLISRKLPYAVLGKFGMELSCKLHEDVADLKFRLVWHDGTYDNIFDINYTPAVDELWLTDGASGHVTIAEDLNLHPQYAPFQTFKLVADFAANEYLRIIVNEKEYDISGYTPALVETDDAKCLRVNVTLYSVKDRMGYVYVDDLIVTQNEP